MQGGVWDQIAGKWKQFTGEARKRWADLTDDDMEYVAGEHDKLSGKIQERYGIAKEEANAQIEEWSNNLKV
ncbi:MAG: CsbD family protein [Armatimonadetes bacterium]|nr:CsbD family protein [Anaerolineae bacterium]